MSSSKKTSIAPSLPTEQLPSKIPEVELNSYLFKVLLDSLPDTIYFKDTEGRFFRVNQAQVDTLGASCVADVMGKSDFDFFEREFAEKAFEDDSKVLKDGESVINKEERVQRKDGVWQWVTATKVPIFNSENEIIGMVGMSRNITQQKDIEQKLRETQAKLEAMTRTDPLTGLLNRRGITEIIEYERGRSLRSSEPFCLILGDLDDFKEINDTLGHDGGDYVLKHATSVIADSLRRQDSISRWGGEEFLIIVPATRTEGGVALAERVRENLEKSPVRFSGKEISLTISLGVNEHDFSESVDDTIKKADVACYRSKAAGKNKVTFI